MITQAYPTNLNFGSNYDVYEMGAKQLQYALEYWIGL